MQFAKGLDGTGNRTAQKMTRDMQEALVTSRAYFQKAQQRAQQYANQHRREEEFQVGDKVLLNTRNLKERGKSMNKLMKKFTGPFEVIKKVGAVSYRLRLPVQMKNFPVFHVSLLKRYHGDPSRQPAPNPQEEIEGENFFKVEKVLDHQNRKRPGKAKKRTKRFFLIRWEGYPPSEDSWEPEENLHECEDALAEYWRTVEVRGRLDTQKQ